MIKAHYAALSVLVLLSVSTLVHAQTGSGSGCVNSPEAPTDVLMFIGSVGMFYGSSVLMKVLRRYGKK
jgi:XrtJ-associated TM-motif-TM protein